MIKKIIFFVIIIILYSCTKKDISVNPALEQSDTINEIINNDNNILQEKIQEIELKQEIKSRINIFNLKIFENIGDNIDYYKDKAGFLIIDNTPSDESREREDPDTEILIKNDEIIIHFVTFYGNTYRYIDLIKPSDNYILGKYIGLSRNQIIKIFGEERTKWPGNLIHLDYDDYESNLFVWFYFEKDDTEKIITHILFGDLRGLR